MCLHRMKTETMLPRIYYTNCMVYICIRWYRYIFVFMFRILSHQFFPLLRAIDIKAESNPFGFSMKHGQIRLLGLHNMRVCSCKNVSKLTFGAKASPLCCVKSLGPALSFHPLPPLPIQIQNRNAPIKERKTLFTDNTQMNCRKCRNKPPFPIVD